MYLDYVDRKVLNHVRKHGAESAGWSRKTGAFMLAWQSKDKYDFTPAKATWIKRVSLGLNNTRVRKPRDKVRGLRPSP